MGSDCANLHSYFPGLAVAYYYDMHFLCLTLNYDLSLYTILSSQQPKPLAQPQPLLLLLLLLLPQC
jgi:hypothetical protein